MALLYRAPNGTPEFTPTISSTGSTTPPSMEESGDELLPQLTSARGGRRRGSLSSSANVSWWVPDLALATSYNKRTVVSPTPPSRRGSLVATTPRELVASCRSAESVPKATMLRIDPEDVNLGSKYAEDERLGRLSWRDVRDQFMRVVRPSAGQQQQRERERFLMLWTQCAAQTLHAF